MKVPTKYLSKTTVFKGINEYWRNRVSLLAHEETYEAGTTIFSDGDEAENIYILLEGMVNIESTLEQGLGTVTVYRVKEGEIFGWSALIEPYSYTASAKCLQKSRVITIKGRDLLRLFEENNRLGLLVTKEIASVVSSRLRQTKDKIVDFIYSRPIPTSAWRTLKEQG